MEIPVDDLTYCIKKLPSFNSYPTDVFQMYLPVRAKVVVAGDVVSETEPIPPIITFIKNYHLRQWAIKI